MVELRIYFIKVSQGFEYVSSSKYARTQIMADCEYARVTQGTEYS